MRNIVRLPYLSFRHGFTLVELVVAISLMTIVGTIVYAAWSQIDRHIYLQQRNTALHNECGRIINEITNQLRCSEAILHWDNSSITYISSVGGDTAIYTFSGTTLEKNEHSIPFVVPKIVVSAFSLENLNKEDGATPYLLQITLTLQHETGMTVTERSTVLGRRISAQEGGGNDFIW